MNKNLRWLVSALLLLGLLGPALPRPMAAAPMESGVYEEDFSTYTRKGYTKDTVWDIWARELRLSQPDGINQYSPDIAISPLDGSIFVVWLQSAYDGNYNIYAQRLDTNGNQLWSGDRRVNSESEAPGRWSFPALAIDTVGNIVVVWHDYREGDANIFIQKLDANGNRLWPTDKRVDSDTGGAWQGNPAISVDTSGNVVVVWEDRRNGSYEIYAQRISPAGNQLWTSDVRVHMDLGMAWQESPIVITTGIGNVIVVWLGEDSRGGDRDIYAQKLNATGERLWGTDLRVNADSGVLNYQSDPAAASDTSDNVMVVWGDYRDSSSGTVYSQRIDVDGNRLWVNDLHVSANSVATPGTLPNIAADSLGYFQVVWQNSSRLYAQRIDLNGNPQWATDLLLVWAYAEDPVLVLDAAGNAVTVWREGDLNGDGNIHAARNNAQGWLIWMDNVQVNAVSGTARQEFPAAAMDTDGNVVVAWLDRRHSDDSVAVYLQRIDAAGNRLWTTDVRVSSDVGYPNKWAAPSVAIDNTGNTFVVWNDYRYGWWVICAQKVDSDGNRLWVHERQVNSDAGNPAYPVVAIDHWGDAVVTWQDYRNGNDDIYAQKIDAYGNRVWQGDVRVNSDSGTAPQRTPAIAMDSSGQPMIVWTDYRSDVSIYAQRLDTAGNRLWVSDLHVSSYVESTMQASPAVAVDLDGNAIVVWRELRTGVKLYAQKIALEGTRMWGDDLQVDSGTGSVYYPVVATDDGGDAWIVWEDDRNGFLGSNYDIYGQRISSDGNRLWAEDLRINSDSGVAGQRNPALAVGDGNHTAVVWKDGRNGNDDIYAQRLDQVGKTWSADLQVVYPDSFFFPIGSIQSRTVDDTDAPITEATLAAHYTLHGGNIVLFLTNDGGVTWLPVTSGVTHVFTTTGSDLRWRAVLIGDPVWRHRTPVVNSLRIEYSTDVSGGDDYEPDDTCTQAQPLAVNGAVQAHTFHQQADEDWAWFDVVSGTTYIIQTSNTQTNADTELELRSACFQPPFAGDDNVFGQDARITWRASFSGPVYVKVSNHDPTVYGADTGYDLSVRTFTQPPVVVIVAGHDDRYSLQSNIDAMADMAYRTFLNSGVPKGNIRYFGPNPARDVDGNGLNDDLYATVTIPGVRDTVQNWSREQGVQLGVPFYVYLVDHGHYDQFLAAGSATKISAADLNLWLSNLEATSGADNLNVILEACKSGSFIDVTTLGPMHISGHNRVVIASTSSTLNAYPSPQGGYFSDVFWTAVGQNQDLKTAFEWAKQAVQATGLSQHPWLDDNGDAVADGRDGALARGRGLGGAFAGSPPVIDWVTVEAASGQATLQAQVRDDFGVSLVWAEVYAPDFVEPEPSQDGTTPVLNIPTTTLMLAGSNLYGATYPLTQTGSYRLVVYALDDEGNRALPQAMRVCAGCTFVYLPLVLRGK